MDTTKPFAPTLDMVAASDSGASNTDNITRDPAPIITGTAEAGATVELFSRAHGTAISFGTATADSNGIWSIDCEHRLNERSNALVAVQTDAAGNVSAASDPLRIIIDRFGRFAGAATPLTLDMVAASDSGASNTDNITRDPAPTITGTAEAGATVELFSRAYGTAISFGTAKADRNGIWSIDCEHRLNERSNALVAVQTDAAGNVSAASDPLRIIIDRFGAATPLTLDMVAASDSGASNTDNITRNPAPTITGTAEAGATVELFSRAHGTAISFGTATADSNGIWSIDCEHRLNERSNALVAVQTDAAGNVSAASDPLRIIVDRLTATPTMDMVTASDSGASNTDNLTQDRTPTITGTAEAGATVKLISYRPSHNDGSNDGSPVSPVTFATATADSNGIWSIDNGDWYHRLLARNIVAVVETDEAGNVSTSAPLRIVTDNSAPEKGTSSWYATEDGISAGFSESVFATNHVGVTMLKNGVDQMNVLNVSGSGTSSLEFHTDQTLTATDWVLFDYTGTSATNGIRDAAGNVMFDNNSFGWVSGGSAVGSVGNNTINLSGALAGTGFDIDGYWGDDILIGSSGGDRIRGDVGADTVTGGAGFDGFDFDQGDSPLVTFEDNDGGLVSDGDTFTFAGLAADLVTDFSYGEVISFNATTFIDGPAFEAPVQTGEALGYMGAYPGETPVDGMAADQGYFAVQGSYSSGVFTVDTISGTDALLVWDGDPSPGLAQTGVVLSGVTVDQLNLYTGSNLVSHV